MEDNSILQPLREYSSVYKHKIVDEAEKYFDELADKASVNKEANKVSYDAYLKAKSELEAQQNIAKKLKRKKTLLMVFGIILAVAIIGIFMIVYAQTTVKKALLNAEAPLKKLEEKTKAAYDECYAQMKPLFDLFDWNMQIEVMNRVTPLIELDKEFDNAKYWFMKQKYGLVDKDDVDSSVVYLQSGQVKGNPFIIQREKKKEMYNHVYTGHLVITYTTTTTDSEGHLRTTTHTTTLTATLTKPAPRYIYNTSLIYSNEAAPDLVFTREPSGAKPGDDKAIEKLGQKRAKEMEKRAAKNMMKGKEGVTTVLSNSVFEGLFGAADRNNEQQFRLLFTPLAQTNMVDLFKSTEGFGDDFYFYKNKYFNTIVSQHMQQTRFTISPADFMIVSYELAKQEFMNRTVEYFKSLYFDLATILSIPLYQQHSPREYIYNDEGKSHFTAIEDEMVANMFDDPHSFIHEDATTDQILKAKTVCSFKDSDQVSVTSYSFQGIPRMTLVPTMGPNGKMYMVPVDWIEYQPVVKKSDLLVTRFAKSRIDFNEKVSNNGLMDWINKRTDGNAYNAVYQKGLLAFVLAAGFSNSEDKELADILKK